MSKREELQHHRRSLNEIREIMNSMKTLAFMETRKLTRFLGTQQAMVRSIEATAADFLSFHPEILPDIPETNKIFLLIGSEHGFCGDFNQSLLRHLETTLQTQPQKEALVIAVGHKLHTIIENRTNGVTLIDGASVTEEVMSILNPIVDTLSDLQEQHGMLSLHGLYHGKDGAIVIEKLLPSFQHFVHDRSDFSHPPELNLAAEEFLLNLTEQYLFAALLEIIYTSMMAENRSRIAHLEGAVKHLDDKSEELARQSNVLRQEEIINEIEVILLNNSNAIQ
ncbi:FoF1 ATP synthase subunit gamma [uncultured Desulfuromusa sp.]|uniref:FoF1 ATP synthase subunit gamma n=1 Tax=uncultured Desulfuromusa sp. TaxID=219183 RepID=UPI002AA8DCFA|nr:FoF1 ATP synthase subunit gamma [uncultured Desulfuromusa sp.]